MMGAWQVVVLSSAELEYPPPGVGSGEDSATNGSLFCYVLYPEEGQHGVSGPCKITRIEIAKLEGVFCCLLPCTPSEL